MRLHRTVSAADGANSNLSVGLQKLPHNVADRITQVLRMAAQAISRARGKMGDYIRRRTAQSAFGLHSVHPVSPRRRSVRL